MPKFKEPISRERLIQANPREQAIIKEEARKILERKKEKLIEELKQYIRISSILSKSGTINILNPHNINPFGSIRYTVEKNSLHLSDLWIGKKDFNLSKTNLLRRLGIGELLLQEAINFAKREKFSNITLNCKPELYRFYNKFGFNLIYMYKKPDGTERYNMILHLLD